MIRGGENDTNECHLAGFGEDVAFTCHFVAMASLLFPKCGYGEIFVKRIF